MPLSQKKLSTGSKKKVRPVEKKLTVKEAVDRKLRTIGYDPSIDIYKERARQVAATQKGLSRLVFDIFGSDTIASLALALDPYSRFRLTNHKIAAVNRHQVLDGIRFSKRFRHRKEIHESASTVMGTYPYSNGASSYLVLNEDSHEEITPQERIPGFKHDTTYKTRKPDELDGEFELYAPSLSTSSYDHDANVDYRVGTVSFGTYPAPASFVERYVYRNNVVIRFDDPSVRIDKNSHDSWLSSYRANALATLAANALPMIGKSLPTSRKFNLAYNIGELKDLPLLLKNSVALYKDGSSILKSPDKFSSQYLNYKFGWESTLQAVRSMLDLPEKVAKKINYLILRQGKPTTFRSRKSFSEPLSGGPTFSTEAYFWDEYIYGWSGYESRMYHRGELRCAVNAFVELPALDPPQLRGTLTDQLFGSAPTPSDIYDWVPWTWLFDWFSGIGDYIHMMDALNNDPSLINYGFLSYVSRGQGFGGYHGVSRKTWGESVTPPPSSSGGESRETIERIAVFDFRYHLRKSILSLANVKSTSDFGTLSDYQASILSALSTKFKGPLSKRGTTFRTT